MTNADVLAEKVMIALDYQNAAQAERLLDSLAGFPCYMKVGMQLYYATGPSFVEQLKRRGYKVFLDLKLHDIPHQVKGAADSIARLGVDMFNVHAAGGIRMMEAALEGAQSGAQACGLKRPLLIAVTQLTSTDREVLNREIGIEGSVEQCVLRYANLAKRSGLDGVVASPREVEAIKNAEGKAFLTVTPGIRPKGSDSGDQARTMTPREAVKAGSDYLVIGRPITAAPDPAYALKRILEEMSEA